MSAFDPLRSLGGSGRLHGVIGKGLSFAVIGLALAATLAACVSVPPPPIAPLVASDELITMENEPGPFCGRCDNVKITALSDGRVWIEHGYWAGRYRDWRVERRLEHALPENFARFREALRPHRPRGELALQEKPPCETFWNDVDGARVEWRDANGTDRLILNFGCDPASKRAMADALRAAPNLLGIATLKIPWGQWVATTPS
jgi:hypothetical protein